MSNPMKARHALASEITRLRRVSGKTLRELADECRCSPAYLCNVERGARIQSLAITQRLEDALNARLVATVEAAVIERWIERWRDADAR